jgi:hypothetical protein
MSDEDFLKRWSRRKRAAEEEAAKAPVAPQPDHNFESDKDTGPAVPQAEVKADDEFDLASLPPLDSITGASDVTAFLRKGVPTELTRAALRRAWVADPAIRDFVGLAENAWDFNDPTAMPGFGPLDWTPEQVRQQMVEMFGETRRSVEAMVEGTNELTSRVQPPAEDKGPPMPPAPDTQASGHEPPAMPLVVAATASEQGAEISAVQQDEKQKDVAPQQQRTHGGALPR